MKILNALFTVVKKIFCFLEALIAIIIGALTVLSGCSVFWMFKTWPNLQLDELIYQLNAPVEGTNLSMIKEYMEYCVPAAILVLLILILLVLYSRRKRRYHKLIAGILVLSAGMVAGALYYTAQRLDLKNYRENKGTYSTFLDVNYADPEVVDITFPEQKRNLIYIFLESMEVTYADEKAGGAYIVNYIPELTELAQENEDFSGENEELNGGYSMPATGWTVAGMFGQSAGLPLSIPLEGNEMEQQASFLPGVTAIGDILEKEGYNQTLLIGSDATFGGRRQLYTDHGAFRIKDYIYAIESGWIPSDYRVWWGYEDQKLFDFAKKELLELSAQDKPFNLTMLTVDTHFEDGYYCEICEDIHNGDNYGNVLSCSSRQVAEFVKWIQQQDFYEDTMIVISGDHLTMDKDFCKEINERKDYTRKVYTTYINSAIENKMPDVRREYTTFDNFPTTLAGMGVSIEGERLGLGTNLFSGEYTLTELYGKDRMASELRKKSKLMEMFTSDLVVEEKKKKSESASAMLVVDNYDYITGVLPLYISEIDDRGKGISAINVAVWVSEDQSDIQWMQAVPVDDGNYIMNINVPGFDYKTGEYKIEVYLVDKNGEQYLLGNVTGYVE